MSAGPAGARGARLVSRLASEYGMFGVLLLLVALFSILTVREQEPTGDRAAAGLARIIAREAPDGARVFIAVRPGEDDARVATGLRRRLEGTGHAVAGSVAGDPAEMRAALERLASSSVQPALPPSARSAGAEPRLFIATVGGYAGVLRGMLPTVPGLGATQVVTPPTRRWPTFLLRGQPPQCRQPDRRHRDHGDGDDAGDPDRPASTCRSAA